MKRRIPVETSAVRSLRLLALIGSLSLLPLLAWADFPTWWQQRGALRVVGGQPVPADDYAALNQGQLKNFAVAAYDELEARLTTPVAGVTGAGPQIEALIQGWFQTDGAGHILRNGAGQRIPKVTSATDDFAAVNLGQLKTVAAPFYARLTAIRYASGTPWATAPTPADDYALANLGQVKNLFFFDLKDSDQDNLPDWWELHWFNSLLPTGTGVSAGGVLTMAQAYAAAGNPTSESTMEDGISDQWKVDHDLSADSVQSSSGDGISDAWKTQYGFALDDPTVASRDEEGDGLTNQQEFDAGTDPKNADTDGDEKRDGDDACPLEPLVKFPRQTPSQYAMIDVTPTVQNFISLPIALNNRGDYVAKAWPLGEYGDHALVRFSDGTENLYGYGGAFDGHFEPHDINDDGTITGDAMKTVSLSANNTVDLTWGVKVAKTGSVTFLPPAVDEGVGFSSAWFITNTGLVGGDETVYCGGLANPDPDVPPSRGTMGKAAIAHGSTWAPFLNDPLSEARRKTYPEACPYTSAVLDLDSFGNFIGYQGDDGTVAPEFGYIGGHVYEFGLADESYDMGIKEPLPDEDPFCYSKGTPELWTVNDDRPNGGFFPLPVKRPSDSGLEKMNKVGVGTNGGSLWRNGEWFDIFKLLGLPKADAPNAIWKQIWMTDINDKNMMIGLMSQSAPGTFNWAGEGTTKAMLLVPAEIMVDANRDGEMSFDNPEPDRTTAQKPYRFWLNNDDDHGTAPGSDGTEHVPIERPDHTSTVIGSQRDLEDWTRLWITFKGITALVKASDITLELQFEAIPGSPTPTIKICKAVETDGGMKYVNGDGNGSTTTASSQAGPSNNAIYGPISGSVSVDLKASPHADWISNLTEENPYLHLLFEGAVEGKGKLQLRIKKGGTLIGTYPDLFLDIKDIKKMYKRAKGTPDAGSDAPYNYTNNPPAPNIGLTPDENGNPFEQPPNEEKKAVVFVHGWNMTYDEFLNFSDTMFKRLWWQGYKGRFCSLRWPTLTSASSYNTSEHRAFKYAPALKQYVEGLPAGYTRNVAAHSMGNIVTGEALRMGMQISNYALMEAAIPAGCYDDSQAINSYQRFLIAEQDRPTPDLANPDKGYRALLKNVSGALSNFYNAQDFALATGTTIGFDTNWEANQEGYKPDDPVGSGQYHYNPAAPATPKDQRGTISFALSVGRFVIDPHEMMSFIARPRSKAVGAEGGTGAPIGSSVNLNGSPYSFGNQRSDHSGQFNRRIQQLQPFYRKLGERLGVLPTQ